MSDGGVSGPAEELARLRQGMYRIFAAAFLPPEPGRLGDIVAGTEMLESMGLQYLAFYPEWSAWREAMAEVGELGPLEVEYVRMFATGPSGAVSPPTESFYRADPVRGEVGMVLAELRAAYDRYRLAPTGMVADTLDHVSIELEVMSALCAREAEAREAGDDRRLSITIGHQREFLDGHLGVWLPRFVARMATSHTAPFYAELGPAVASFVHHDAGVARLLSRTMLEAAP